jgi:hypothetical protein
MGRTLVVFFTVLFAGAARPGTVAASQGDVGGGYSWAHINNGAGENIPGGWFGTVGINLAPMIDVVGDFSGQYKSEAGTTFRMHSYLGGPRIRWSEPMMPVSVYGQFTVGGQTESASCSGCTSESFLALAPGAGLDIRINGPWSARVGFNYRLVRPKGGNGEWEKISQMVFGLTYNWKN